MELIKQLEKKAGIKSFDLFDGIKVRAKKAFINDMINTLLLKEKNEFLKDKSQNDCLFYSQLVSWSGVKGKHLTSSVLEDYEDIEEAKKEFETDVPFSMEAFQTFLIHHQTKYKEEFQKIFDHVFSTKDNEDLKKT